MTKRLFGTDGVRGLANKELTPQLAFDLGRAACMVLAGSGKKAPVFVIGKDTRLSCSLLETALESGIMSVGGNVIALGVIPTPAVAVLTRYYEADAGVVISASHNPYYDNGIKFFNASGLKLADKIEDEIQRVMEEKTPPRTCINENVGTMKIVRNAGDLYLDYIQKMLPDIQLNGLKIVLDCANGATYLTAPEIFSRLGAEIRVLSCKPDGKNINDGCGSTHIAGLQNEVMKEQADFGLAFDGDGDRLIAVDENGRELNGDAVMYICARHLKAEKKLAKNTVVGTIMSNMGLQAALNKEGIDMVRTSVGDRYILQKMIECGYTFGGEQSGHLICSAINTTGDGIASALLLASIVQNSGRSLSQNAAGFIPFPQVLVNVRLEPEKKYAYQNSDEIREAVDALNKKYDGQGRVLLRHSGTEPLVRIMVEGRDTEQISRDAQILAELVAKISK